MHVTAATPAARLDSARSAPRPSRYPMYVAGLLGCIAFVNALDQSILGSVLPSIQKEFQLSDTQVGLLASVFVAGTVLATFPMGYLADRAARRVVIGLGVAFWSLITLLTGLTGSFPQLLAARSLLGVGEASYSPAGSSLIADYFPKTARGRAMGLVNVGFPIGLGVGLIGGGALAVQLGWRPAFFLAAVPGLLLALLMIGVREPQRGATERMADPRRAADSRHGTAVLALLRIPTYVAAVAAATFAQFASAGVFQFLPLYLNRELGLDMAQAGALVGVPVLVSSLVGIPFGGWLVDWRGQRSGRALMEVATGGLLIAAAGSVVAFWTTSLVAFVGGLLVALVGFAAGGPALMVVNQNAVVPQLRARAVSIRVVVMNLFGFALGPLAIGLVSDSVHDLRLTILLLMPSGFLVAAVCASAGLRTIRQDVQRMEASLSG